MSNEYTPKGTYTPTTDDVETAFHQFASWLESTSPGEYEDAPEFADWREAMHGFRRWLAKVKAKAQVEVLREAAMEFYRDGEGEWDGYGVSHALTIDADRIAREAGIETGESK